MEMEMEKIMFHYLIINPYSNCITVYLDEGDVFPKPPKNNKAHPRIVARILSAVGHIALMHLYHLDVSILSELKRRHNIQEEEKEKKGQKSTKTPGGSRRKSERDSTASSKVR